MKKIFAVTLCLMLLLSGCTINGQEVDVPSVDVLLSDLLFSVDGAQVVDLEGVSALISAGTNDQAAGVRFLVTSGDGEENSITLALLNDGLLIILDSAAGEPKTYAVSAETLASVMGEIGGELEGVLEDATAAPEDAQEPSDGGEMTDEQLQQAMDELEKQLGNMGMEIGGILNGETSPEEPVDDLEQLQERLLACISEGEPLQFNGEDYQTVNISIDHDTLMELLDLVYDDMPVDFDASEIFEQAGVTAALSGTVAINADETKAAVGISLDMQRSDGETANITLTIQDISDDGTVDIYFEVTVDDEQLVALGLSINVTPTEAADWLPTEISDDAIFITEDDTQVLDELEEDFTDLFAQIAGTVLGIEVGNQAINGLESIAP